MRFYEAFLHSPAVECLAWTLLHSLWQGALIVLLLLVNFRQMSASHARYFAACVGLVLQGVIFAATFFFFYNHMLPERYFESAPSKLSAFEIPAEMQKEIPIAAQTTTVAPAGGFFRKAVPWISLLYLFGVVTVCIYNVGGWVALQRLRTLGRKVDPWLEAMCAQLMERLNIRRPIWISQSEWVHTPLVVGFLKPIILIPTGLLLQISPRELETLLIHELAHIRRQDYLINLFQTVFDILFFYHPAAWWISARIRTERENCCDDMVTSLAEDREVYAYALATVAQSSARLAMAASGGTLLYRVQRILGGDDLLQSRLRWADMLLATSLFILAAGFFGCLRFSSSMPERPINVTKVQDPPKDNARDPALVSKATPSVENTAPPDPRITAQETAKLPDWKQRVQTIRNATYKWAKKDPQQATLWAWNLPRGTEQDEILATAMMTWAKNDPKAAQQWVDALPKEVQQRAVNKVVSATAEQDAALTVQWIQTLPPDAMDNMTFYSAAVPWARKDPRAAAQWAAQLPESQGKNIAIASIVDIWANEDLPTAEQWVDALPPGNARASAMGGLACVWAKQDATAATARILQIRDPEERYAAILGVATVLQYFKGFEAVSQWLKKLPPDEQNGIVRHIAILWAQEDLDAAKRWAEALSGERRHQAINQIASAASQQDAALTAQWIQKLPPDAIDNTTFQYVACPWARKDPQAAAQWAVQLPESQVKDIAITQVANIWAEKNLPAATQWAETLPPGSTRASALKGIASASSTQAAN